MHIFDENYNCTIVDEEDFVPWVGCVLDYWLPTIAALFVIMLYHCLTGCFVNDDLETDGAGFGEGSKHLEELGLLRNIVDGQKWLCVGMAVAIPQSYVSFLFLRKTGRWLFYSFLWQWNFDEGLFLPLVWRSTVCLLSAAVFVVVCGSISVSAIQLIAVLDDLRHWILVKRLKQLNQFAAANSRGFSGLVEADGPTSRGLPEDNAPPSRDSSEFNQADRHTRFSTDDYDPSIGVGQVVERNI